jgi:hypothetical protein
MFIGIDEIDIPPEIVIFYAIPKDERDFYKVRSMNGGEYFLVIVKSKMEKAAFVYPMSDGRYEFTFFGHGSSLKFKRIMEAAQPVQNNNLKWLVVFPMNSSDWTYIGRPEMSKELALKWVSRKTLNSMAILVSYLPGATKDNWLKVESANYLEGDWPNVVIVEGDMGAKKFRICDEY